MKTCAVFMTALALLSLAGCGTGGAQPTHDSLTQESLNLMKEMTALVKSVTDEASAKAAEPKFEALGKKAQEIKDAMEKLGPPSPEVQKELETKYMAQMQAAGQEMSQAMMRLTASPELMQQVSQAMQKLQVK